MRPAAVGYQCPECLAAERSAGFRYQRGVRTRRVTGPVTRVLILANVAMFVAEVAVGGAGSLLTGPSGERLVRLGALYTPAVACGHEYWRLITAAFLHAGILHIALNMYALWLFGSLMEDALGSAPFLGVYLVSGFVASATSFAFGPVFLVAVGASGAIFGLLGAWFTYNFRRRHIAFNRAQLNGAITLIVLNLVLSFGLASFIDWRAHVGGLVAGVFLGATAEGLGDRRTRPWVIAAGFVAALAVGVALTAYRVHALAPACG
jgi:membrane associated rhomboid family serine protease